MYKNTFKRSEIFGKIQAGALNTVLHIDKSSKWHIFRDSNKMLLQKKVG